MFPELWGVVPHVPQNINYLGNREHWFPKFLKSVWGTGTIPQVPQKCLGDRNSSPSSSKVFGEQEQFPKFLKSFWGTGTVPQVPQKFLGKILGNFGEQARH